MSVLKRVAFPTALSGTPLSSSVSSGVPTISIKPTPSAGWSLQASWKPCPQPFKAGIGGGVLGLHLIIPVGFLFPHKPWYSMERGKEFHPGGDSGQSWNAGLHFGEGVRSQVFQFMSCFRLHHLLFLAHFYNSPSFLRKSSLLVFCFFCLLWPYPLAPKLFQLHGPS